MHGMLHPEGGHILVGKRLEDKDFEGVCAFHGDCLEVILLIIIRAYAQMCLLLKDCSVRLLIYLMLMI